MVNLIGWSITKVTELCVLSAKIDCTFELSTVRWKGGGVRGRGYNSHFYWLAFKTVNTLSDSSFVILWKKQHNS